MSRTFLDGKVVLHGGDSREVLKTLPEASVDSVVCDPPYSLAFMGKAWDTGETAFATEFWAQVLRVLKPGGHLVAFSGTRTYHRLACAIEDAGFEIRDQLAWAYGSGFPKSLDVSKALDKEAGAEREVVGSKVTGNAKQKTNGTGEFGSWGNGNTGGTQVVDITAPATPAARQWSGWGTALKPAYESICLARKPSEFWADYDIIGSKLAMLEAGLWSMSLASAAALSSQSSQSEFAAACATARWSAADAINTRAALCAQMGTSPFESALISSLSTVPSWKSTWAAGSTPANTSTTETALSTTTELRTLKFCLSQITPDTIIQAHKSGRWSSADASTAARLFSATVAGLSVTLELRALGPATAQLADASLDAGVRPNWNSIVLARKPLVGTVAQNVTTHGTGALNIDGCRVGVDAADANHRSPSVAFDGATGVGYSGGLGGRPNENLSSLGRWPANLLHDGSEEVVALFPAETRAGHVPRSGGSTAIWGTGKEIALDVGVNNGFGDSGSAARFFASFPVEKECRCGLCRLLYVPDSHTTDECNANAAASTLPTSSTQADGSAPSGVADSSLRVASDIKSRSQRSARGAGVGSSPCPPQRRSTAQSSAPTPPTSSLVQNVKSAANLCGSCATAIAHALVEARQHRSAASIPFPGSIDGRSSQILRQSIALYVAGREDTDIITTTPSLKILLGSVFHAIAESTPGSAGEQLASSEKSRRFWYDSKADADDRLGSRHPTVKPVSLMQWLVRLVTKKGGTVLDCFAGTGTTGEAAWREGCRAILIEREEEYISDIARRMDLAQRPTKRAAVAKTKNKLANPNDLPLFAMPEAAE
jgi:DNA modification methylase